MELLEILKYVNIKRTDYYVVLYSQTRQWNVRRSSFRVRTRVTHVLETELHYAD